MVWLKKIQRSMFIISKLLTEILLLGLWIGSTSPSSHLPQLFGQSCFDIWDGRCQKEAGIWLSPLIMLMSTSCFFFQITVMVLLLLLFVDHQRQAPAVVGSLFWWEETRSCSTMFLLYGWIFFYFRGGRWVYSRPRSKIGNCDVSRWWWWW